ncbi:unnamed protein product [Clonostachys rhizophaga]|uniref:Uncharacterized protein n=1 Tax=Clonostachys rhizophaga TaxID=160324 RepID=A0A9N9YHM9_9HYPO|nr:unnamed protein product [Clonostachys rhizophaga]
MHTCLTTPKRLATVSCMPMTLPTGPIAALDITIPYTSTVTTPHSNNTATSTSREGVAAMLDLHPLRPRPHLRQDPLSQRQRQRRYQRDPSPNPLPAVPLLLLDGRGVVDLRGLRASHALEPQDELQLQHQDVRRGDEAHEILERAQEPHGPGVRLDRLAGHLDVQVQAVDGQRERQPHDGQDDPARLEPAGGRADGVVGRFDAPEDEGGRGNRAQEGRDDEYDRDGPYHHRHCERVRVGERSCSTASAQHPADFRCN